MLKKNFNQGENEIVFITSYGRWWFSKPLADRVIRAKIHSTLETADATENTPSRILEREEKEGNLGSGLSSALATSGNLRKAMTLGFHSLSVRKGFWAPEWLRKNHRSAFKVDFQPYLQ